MFFSKRVDIDKSGITAEIAEFRYEFTLKNKMTIIFKEGDLFKFIFEYIPELRNKVFDYLEPVLKELNHKQNIDLCYFVRFKIDTAIRKHFLDALYDIEMNPFETTGYYYDAFVDMKADDNGAEFFKLSKEAFNAIKNGEQEKITRNIELKKPTWTFVGCDLRFLDNQDSCIFIEDNESTIVLRRDAILEMIEYIRNDFITNGENTLEALKKKNTSKYVSVQFFLENFEKDLIELENSDFTYEQFANFLHKYKLISEGE